MTESSKLLWLLCACQAKHQSARRARCSECQGRAVAVGCECGFTVSVAIVVSAPDPAAAAVTAVLNQVGCRPLLLLATEI